MSYVYILNQKLTLVILDNNWYSMMNQLSLGALRFTACYKTQTY